MIQAVDLKLNGPDYTKGSNRICTIEEEERIDVPSWMSAGPLSADGIR